MPHNKALSKAKIALLAKTNTAFYAHICFSLNHSFDESVGTALTNGMDIVYSPKFFMGLTPQEQLFLVLHETRHVTDMHIERRGDREHSLWNQAADYVINLDLVNSGYKMPKEGLLDRRFLNQSVEQVYNQLKKEKHASPSFVPDLGSNPSTPEQAQANQEKLDNLLVQAAIKSKMEGDAPGTIPKHIELYLEKLTKPKMDWRVLLKRFVNGFAREDYSFRRPNRKYLPDWYLPTLHSESLSDITVLVDTSGSVSPKDFAHFITEVAAVFKSVKPKKITVVQFDTAIKSVTETKNIQELLAIKFTGRGGTRIVDITSWINKNKPTVSIVFTDGYFLNENQESKQKVLWLIHNNTQFKEPYGRSIHYKLD